MRTTHTHTESPWHLGKRAGNPAIYGKDGTEIAKILHELTPEWRENVRLIAAAPELLEALQMLMPQEPNEADSYDAAMWRNARNAIDNATGRANA